MNRWNLKANRWLLALVAAGTLALSGCGYGKVGPETYKYATALYSICNRRDEKGLDKITDMLAQASQEGAISSREAAWLDDIVEEARGGDWESSAAQARRMLSDQVERVR
ncbi:hypothetical protein Pan216_46910 [Planctomycetes bacterium Pan216]|uniref:Uncharacterized protein n=1 Tax=Kolteria novifilia TaxID=2527975 RepID=A0A518B9Z4_9BACT|nr:hypothetical protein Pan216_46910 [Planctomycetes bacterium Pan216]